VFDIMRIPQPVRWASFSIGAALATFVLSGPVGCSRGPATGEVSGKVTYKGSPVTEGSVTFLNPTEGGAAEAQIEKDGSYKVGGVVVGEYLVEIKPLWHVVDTDPGKSPPAPMEKPAPNIPKKYRMQGTTPLKASVKQGPNEINFEMS
jgi:hypothetical protein